MAIFVVFFFFQAEDGIRVLVRSRGLGDVYKRQSGVSVVIAVPLPILCNTDKAHPRRRGCTHPRQCTCLLYTSDAADDLLCVDLGGRRIIKKKNTLHLPSDHYQSRPALTTPPTRL